MGRLIDLSYALGSDLPPMKGHPVVDYRLTDTHEVHRRTNAVISFSIHMGTHIDPPYHYIPDGETIDQLPLERFYTPGFVFNLRGRVPEYTAIHVRQLLEGTRLPDGGLRGYFVIVNSGWAAENYHKAHYYSRAPWLATETAEWFVAQGVGAVGLDHPPDKLTLDPATDRLEPGDSPVHRTLLGNKVLIVENLANVDQLGSRPFRVAAFPLKIHRGCGGPARVVAIEE